jgi:quercetin dioxygenase-like cupin family protein
MSIKPAGKVTPQKVDKAVKTEIEWLVDRHDGAPNFEMRKFTIKPGGSIPKHYHHDIEHEQYVLKGRYKVGIGNRVHEVRKGDSIYIPPGTPHWYENTGKVAAEFLCIVPKKEKYDSVYVEATSRK